MDPTHLQDQFGADPTAIVEAAWADHAAGLQAYLTSLTRDPTTAEDVAQEAFLRLTREVGAGRTPDNIGGWLHRVATNVAMSRARHNQVVDRYAPTLFDRRVGDSPEDEVLRHERDRQIRDALAVLSETDRAAVWMAAEGYGGPEIARALARTQAATRTLLCRARTRLRGSLSLADVTA
jgi:RNA polymerase sigma-70 factor (ECF subfamily)